MISKDRQSQALHAIPEDGITSNELSKRLCWAWNTVQQTCCYLVNAGQLFKAKMGHRTVRYFRDKTRAELYEQEHKATKYAVVTIKSRAFKADAEVVTPKHVKVKRGPSTDHDHRYQVAPGTKVVGEFMSDWLARRGS